MLDSTAKTMVAVAAVSMPLSGAMTEIKASDFHFQPKRKETVVTAVNTLLPRTCQS